MSLRKFSRSVYIPKERAVLSFLAMEKIWNGDAVEGEADVSASDSPAAAATGAASSVGASAATGAAVAAGASAANKGALKDKKLALRITSDPIRLPGSRTGYYACSSLGLLLVVTGSELHSGELLEVELDSIPTHRDAKSGAIVIDIE